MQPNRDALAHEIAAGLVRTWSALQGAGDDAASHDQRARDQSNLSPVFWDAAIVAAARALGCRELLSEDMSHGREVEGVIINDPFRSTDFAGGGADTSSASDRKIK